MTKQRTLHRTAAIAMFCATLLPGAAFHATPAHAQDASGYPNKPIQVIVPFPPGIGVDVVIRIIGPRLGASL
ncbi:MAG: tripartite tricarboxylate transporter substrate binding protein, partial [Casimicrobiaceae bacterium]